MLSIKDSESIKSKNRNEGQFVKTLNGFNMNSTSERIF
jgi:hypothetical protein